MKLKFVLFFGMVLLMPIMGCCCCPTETIYMYTIINTEGVPVTITSTIPPSESVDWEAHGKLWVRNHINNRGLPR